MPYDAGDDAGRESTQSMSKMTRDFVSRYVFPRIEESLSSAAERGGTEPGRLPAPGTRSPGYDLMVMTYSFGTEAKRDAFVERLEEKNILVQSNANPINGQYVATVAFDPLLGEGSIVNSTLASLGIGAKGLEAQAPQEAADAHDAPLPSREGEAEIRDPEYSVSVDEELEDAAMAIQQEEASTEIGEVIVDIAEKVR